MKIYFKENRGFLFKTIQILSFLALFFVCINLIFHNSLLEAQEGIPCSPEPTVMEISYGDLVICSIDTPGDTDTFWFSGVAGESIVIIGSSTSSVRTCFELIAPDNSKIVACENSFSNRIDTVLDQTGTYPILFKEYSDIFTGEYALSLERVIPPSPTAQVIQYGDTLIENIDPHGDVDLFYFSGKAGESSTIVSGA